jgi:hypothetical protein
MTLKIDPRLVEPMVAHARGETMADDEAEGEGEAVPAAASEPVASES